MKNLLTISTFYFLFIQMNMNVKAQQKSTVSDIDGNVYETIVIGNQEWMAENLRTTHYADGTPITLNESNWGSDSTGVYCWYNNDKGSYENLYGALYNWYTLINENVCPDGWHVPSDSEWKILEGNVDSLYGIGNAVWDTIGLRGYDVGKKLKTTTWDIYSNSINGTNDYGFNAYPSGSRASDGTFIPGICQWWCYSSSDTVAWKRLIHHNYNSIERRYSDTASGKNNGYSIRCINNTETSASEIEDNNLVTYYPNPTDGHLCVKLTSQIETTVSIYSVSGKLIYTEQLNKSINYLNLTNYKKGIYLIQIQNSDVLSVGKIVIK